MSFRFFLLPPRHGARCSSAMWYCLQASSNVEGCKLCLKHSSWDCFPNKLQLEQAVNIFLWICPLRKSFLSLNPPAPNKTSTQSNFTTCSGFSPPMVSRDLPAVLRQWVKDIQRQSNHCLKQQMEVEVSSLTFLFRSLESPRRPGCKSTSPHPSQISSHTAGSILSTALWLL